MTEKIVPEEIFLSSIKNQLVERKARLHNTIKTLPDSGNLFKLLKEVDYALERIGNGTYGLCEVCKDPIEPERLLADPLTTLCLDHLNTAQRRALELDLEYAGKIQQVLLPKKEIKTCQWDFAFHYQPAGTVSGDFCDVIEGSDNSLTFIIGDVSGKGVSASLMMTHLHALLHSLLSFNLPINEILQRANRLFSESTLSTNYATMVFGRAFDDGTINISVAGHNPPLICKGGEVISIGATGFPIGMFADAEYDVETFHLESGDGILLYTDGLTEAAVNEIEFGEARVKDHFYSLGKVDSKKIINSLLSEHTKFLNNASVQDDITIAVLKKL